MMCFFGPVTTTCAMCDNDIVLGAIKTLLTVTQRGVATTWKAGVVEGGVVLSYEAFKDVWTGMMLQNPLDYDWRGFDSHNAFDQQYLYTVVDILEQQVVLYVGEPVGVLLGDFVDALFALLGYTSEIKV